MAFGILVALAILIASIHFKDPALSDETVFRKGTPQRKPSVVLIKKILEKASSKIRL